VWSRPGSQAALTVRPSADVIHLLAELIENATTLSPPIPRAGVRETVANGSRSSRGPRLGMSPPVAELNDRLATPEFNPSDSEQLGLLWSASWPNGTGSGHAEGRPTGHGPIVSYAAHGGDRGGVPDRAAREPLWLSSPPTATRVPPPRLGLARPPGIGSGFTDLGGMPGLGQTPGVRISGRCGVPGERP